MKLSRLCILVVLFLLLIDARARAAAVFVRVKVVEPPGAKFRLTLGGFRHAGEPWYFSPVSRDIAGGTWSDWVDLSTWPWHGRLDREGGLAEWPSMRISIEPRDEGAPKSKGCKLEVQLADEPQESAAIISFTEASESNSIGFLVPTPLREHAREFETGSQMTARHLAWARQATGNRPIRLNKFDVCTSIWGHYDPALARQALETLRTLGINVVNPGNSLTIADLQKAGFRTYRQEWLYEADPQVLTRKWNESVGRRIPNSLKSEEGRWEMLDGVAHWVLADEIRTVNLGELKPAELNDQFRSYLRQHNVRPEDIGGPIDQATYPLDMLRKPALPRDANLTTRRLAYHAAKFVHYWSALQLRHVTDTIHASLPGSRTETLPSDHGFFNAWGPPCIGMSYTMLDLFEVAAQHGVDQLSAEDWLGLNHMYGPSSTWTGAQSLAYLNAIMRSAIADQPILLRTLITPSDDNYLRLKAYSALGQGSRSFFFWTYGPTYIGTENYWSDLRSMYDGIAKVDRAIEKSEDVLVPAKPVRDPVAILYSVSHDIWNTDNPAAFVEKRLLWHALRHTGIQPDFLREEDIEAGRLQGYKVLYITDWCLARTASAAIDQWVRAGGTVFLTAGAATRDEACEPHLAPFAAAIWPDNAASALVAQRHRYNERVDLPTIKPLTTARVLLPTGAFDIPVIGCRQDLRTGLANPMATFADNRPAAATVSHGNGKVIAVGFCPMLAYGQLAGFKPATMEEKWPAGPRQLIQTALTAAKLRPAVRTSHPVVEPSLLTGPKGSVLILANYTYQPIAALAVDIDAPVPSAQVFSTEGHPVRVEKTPTELRLTLPLDCTDLIVLK